VGNAVIGHLNQCDTAVLSGGSWRSTLPLSNLQNRQMGKVARSTDATTGSTKFDAALASSVPIRVLAFAAHNLSDAALYRVEASNSSGFGALTYDSGWLDVWPAAYLATVTDKGEDIWTKAHVLAATVSSLYWRVLFDDASNPDGYVQIGRLFIGKGFQPEINLQFNGSIGIETATPTQVALNGAEYFDHRPSARVVKASTQFMTENEAMSEVYEIVRRSGIDGEVVFVWDPDDTTHAPRRQFLAHLRTLSEMEDPFVDQWNYSWEFKELI